MVYNYDSTGNNGKGVYYVGLNTTLNLSVVEILGKYNDGIHGEKSVTYIKFEAFKDNVVIRRVVLPESITDLDGNAFWGCSNLEFISMTGVKTLNYGETQRPYGKRYGNNNFRECTALKVVITSTSFSSNVGQFGAGTAPETPALDFYVKGESGAPQMQDDNLLSGKVYYYSETQKAGCWHYTLYRHTVV